MIKTNFSLKEFNTFGIDVTAENFISAGSIDELIEVLRENEDVFVLGGGSNMLLTSDLEQTVLHVDLKGKQIIEENENDVLIKCMAGENWHEFVLWSLEQDFGGIENLSLIPGNVGTAPIQNIGAYGVELKDCFVECEALNRETLKIEIFTKDDCKFGYRQSVFKNELKDQYIICSITLKLSKNDHKLHTSYGAISKELSEKGLKNPTIKDVSDAVISIRRSKLPDPKEIGNSGSFFKNPVISKEKFKHLQANFPEIPSYPAENGQIKVPAGWLIEKAGFKGKRIGNYGVHAKQALVLVNYGGASGDDIKALSELIQKTIEKLFGIKLDAEVNII